MWGISVITMKGGSHLVACIKAGTWAGQSMTKHGLVPMPVVPHGEKTAKDNSAVRQALAGTRPTSAQVTRPCEPGGIFSPTAQMMKLSYQASRGDTAQEHRACVAP